MTDIKELFAVLLLASQTMGLSVADLDPPVTSRGRAVAWETIMPNQFREKPFEPFECSPNDDEKVCLACNVYHEARGESNVGQLAVGLVTLNRLEDDRFPDSFCAVVWENRTIEGVQIGQFSWTTDGKPDAVNDAKAWSDALWVAGMVMRDHESPYWSLDIEGMRGTVLWYHNNTVQPDWSRKFALTHQIGTHLFYANAAIPDS